MEVLLHLLCVFQFIEQSVITYNSGRFTRQANFSNLSKGVKMENRVIGVGRSKGNLINISFDILLLKTIVKTKRKNVTHVGCDSR